MTSRLFALFPVLAGTTASHGTPSPPPVRYGVMVDVFDVVADPTRRDILRLLDDASTPGEMSVGELVDALGITQPTVSKHLKVLRDADLVGVREDGQHRYYHFVPSALGELRSWLRNLGDVEREAEVVPLVDLELVGRAVGGTLRDVRVFLDTAVRRIRP